MAQGKLEAFFLVFSLQTRKDLLSRNSSSISFNCKGFAKSTLISINSADVGNISEGFPTIFSV